MQLYNNCTTKLYNKFESIFKMLVQSFNKLILGICNTGKYDFPMTVENMIDYNIYRVRQ